jgi:hypothetical protein
VLTGFLLFAGVGSAASSRFAERVDAWHKAHPGRGPQLSVDDQQLPEPTASTD